MHVSSLFIYPVKSLRGFAADSAGIDEIGFVGDRRFMLIDDKGQFLTQRVLPLMALIETALTDRDLVLRAPHGGSCSVPLRAIAPAPLVTVRVWKSDPLLAEDCGVEVAVWLSEVLRAPCQLVRIGEKFIRRINKPGKSLPGDLVNFADSHPFMILSDASLADLNARLAEPLPIDRFRPSFTVGGCDAYAEDTWKRIQIGAMTFRTGGPCARCIVTTTNQQTAERGKEPLRTLATYRRAPEDPTDVNFGQNLVHESKQGTLKVGDEVRLLD
ncbi:MAG: molybdenum cofactor biosysynthesis protein [Verrucomicrobia bacterium]|nr:molybdenum cofactor biosysynthesis protein [Verrucomicrobiota bacterium]